VVFGGSLAACTQSAHGRGAVSVTGRLEIVLEGMGMGKGDEVMVHAISLISTATAVSRAGATPVCVDIEPSTFQIDPGRALSAPGDRHLMLATRVTQGHAVLVATIAGRVARTNRYFGRGSLGHCGPFSPRT